MRVKGEGEWVGEGVKGEAWMTKEKRVELG